MSKDNQNLKIQTFDRLESVETSFSCAHFYQQEKWDETKNHQTFGKCFSKYGHGHDYSLRIWHSDIADGPDKDQRPKNRQWSELVSNLRDHLDHKHLNFDFTYFKNINPTTENIALFIFKQIPNDMKASLYKVELYERPDIWVELLNEGNI